MSYSLPIKIYTILEKALGKQDAETLAIELENSLKETIEAGKRIVKSDLKDELATKEDLQILKEVLETKFDERFKLIDFKLNIVVGIAFLALTLFNPALLAFLTKVFKL